MLENYLSIWLSDALYKKRKNWCGGETGNGFELWRRLRADYKGKSGAVIKVSGVTALQTFPK